MKIKLAVFGHYDSRGGTTGMPLPDPATLDDVRKAITEYNKVFYWEDTLKEYAANPSGFGWNPTEPGSSPGEQDFMYVADLHYEGELPEGDLDSGNRKVLIDPTHEGDTDMDEWDDKNPASDDWIAYSLDNPVDLEFIEMPEGYDKDIKMHEEGTTMLRKVTFDGMSFSSKWTDVQKAESKRLDAIMEGLEATRNGRILDARHYLGERAEVRRWDDDAFGFIIGTGL